MKKIIYDLLKKALFSLDLRGWGDEPSPKPSEEMTTSLCIVCNKVPTGNFVLVEGGVIVCCVDCEEEYDKRS